MPSNIEAIERLPDARSLLQVNLRRVSVRSLRNNTRGCPRPGSTFVLSRTMNVKCLPNYSEGLEVILIEDCVGSERNGTVKGAIQTLNPPLSPDVCHQDQLKLERTKGHHMTRPLTEMPKEGQWGELGKTHTWVNHVSTNSTPKQMGPLAVSIFGSSGAQVQSENIEATKTKILVLPGTGKHGSVEEITFVERFKNDHNQIGLRPRGSNVK
ncbi:hypothetical protein BDZ97DRAFT_1759120 [Flammula alnicola]|nr:hypothetical protein BDZ97DRAFT_1759120 [Flammula alnicola]